MVGETSLRSEAAQERQNESLHGRRIGFLKMFLQTGHLSSASIVVVVVIVVIVVFVAVVVVIIVVIVFLVVPVVC